MDRIWQRTGRLPSEIWKISKENPLEFALLMASEVRACEVEVERAKRGS